ncbi:pilin isopeptide linkage protein [Breznakia blatticola]|uniref:Pilin isopeptide linkage protein n=1 Tax=Breznakia blatticola TaxID=1754012 RepID=A0A4R7ZRM4_9FIRM|nr:FctA domain-containing protein [Breznakia blatticola]TDW20627.1 pilin isopeptide linkage protein [Breznakia blatticola]
MQKVTKKWIKFSICCLLLFVAAIHTIENTHVYAANKEVSIILPLRQVVTTETTKNVEDFSFDYCLEALSENAPLPDGKDGSTYTFSLTGNMEKNIGVIRYENVGVYKYSLYQIHMDDLKNFTYDTKVYTLTVYIKWDRDGDLIAEIIGDNGSGEKPEKLEFVNTYKKTVIDDTTDDKNDGKKSNEQYSDGDGKQPDTGDVTRTKDYIACILISAIVILVLYKSRKREKQNLT